MSLDVYLYEVVDTTPPELCLQCIVMPLDADDQYIEDRHCHERCVFSQNVTHNLGKMADAAGIYYALWRPEELMDPALAARIDALENQYFDAQGEATRHYYDEAQVLRQQLPTPRARDILPLLRQGLAAIRADYPTFIALEPENKWGSMATFLPWIEKYIKACNEYPDALVRVSR